MKLVSCDNDSDLYPKGSQFKSRPTHRLI